MFLRYKLVVKYVEYDYMWYMYLECICIFVVFECYGCFFCDKFDWFVGNFEFRVCRVEFEIGLWVVLFII